MTNLRSQVIYAVSQDQGANPEPLEKLVAEIEELQARNNRTYCAYCGYEVPLAVPGADLIVHDHILNCEHHPLGIKIRELKEQIERQNADPIWKACERLYEVQAQGTVTIMEAVDDLVDAWDRMLG